MSARLDLGAPRIVAIAIKTPAIFCLAGLRSFIPRIVESRPTIEVVGGETGRAPAIAKRARSFLVDDLLDVLQKRRAIDNRRRRVLDDPLFPDHPLRIDEKERPVGDHRLFVEYPVAADNLSLRKVAEQRVRELERFGKGLL